MARTRKATEAKKKAEQAQPAAFDAKLYVDPDPGGIKTDAGGRPQTDAGGRPLNIQGNAPEKAARKK